jgi:hypothetical protein
MFVALTAGGAWAHSQTGSIDSHHSAAGCRGSAAWTLLLERGGDLDRVGDERMSERRIACPSGQPQNHRTAAARRLLRSIPGVVIVGPARGTHRQLDGM